VTDLLETADLVKAYADPTRLRLLALLAREALSVAELVQITGLVQSRVSSHLKTLREAGLLGVRRSGPSTLHALDEDGMSPEGRRLWDVLREVVRDALLDEDTERLEEVLASRRGSWADRVAGSMERRYSPGRTWQSAARALAGVGVVGDVLDVASGDGALSELIAPHARSTTCLDRSQRVVEAAHERLGDHPRVRLVVGDMHALPFADAAFDHVLLLNSLSFAERPREALAEAARVLRPGGQLVASVLRRHRHQATARRFNHVQPGFEPDVLAGWLTRHGLSIAQCRVTSRERRAPHFEVVTVHACRPPDGAERSPAPRRAT